MKFIIVYATTTNRLEANRIGEVLLRERLVACVNVVGPITSSYWWKGRIAKSREVLFLAKTRATLARAVIRKVKALHSYDVPCVVALPISQGNSAFLRWIEIETSPELRKKMPNPAVRRASRNGSDNTAASIAP